MFMNELLGLTYKSLTSFKRLQSNIFPPSKVFVKLMANTQYDEIHKNSYTEDIPTTKLVDKLLSCIQYSLTHTKIKASDDKEQTLYSIKSYRYKQQKNE